MQLIIDEETNELRVRASKSEYRRMKRDAARLGVSVQQMLQAELDKMAAEQRAK
jgi:ribosomal 50S subunit-associated protein YjgA (DUF615 family)